MRNLTLIALTLTICVLTLFAQTAPKQDAPVSNETVLFVCEHGAAKSVIAAAYFNKLAQERGLKVKAVARGTNPDPSLAPAAVQGLKGDGVALTTSQPALVSPTEIATAGRVFTFGCTLPGADAAASTKVVDWKDVPSVSENYAAARGAIVAHVQALVESLAQTAPKQDAPANTAHFHHLQLNTTDPARALEFYTSRFACEKAKYNGQDAVWAQKSWILFNKVKQQPPYALTSTIWHFGWGAENMPAEYERQQKLGTKFHTPLTDISDIGGNPNAKPGSFYYAYVESPDHALIELNTAGHHRFGHLHLFSADPLAAGQWYINNFGAKGRISTSREPRMYRGIQIGPSASVTLDNVNIIIFPVEYVKQSDADAWKGRTTFDSTKGRVVDHIGISVDKLDDYLAQLKKGGVTVVEGIKSKGGIKSALIEGPDRMLIQLIEGHARKE